MQLSPHAGGVQLHVLYNYDKVVKSNYYYIFTIANLLFYFIVRYFSVYLSYSQPNFGYKV